MALNETRLTEVSIFVPPGARFTYLHFWIISKLVDKELMKCLARAREGRQIAPQASAGYPPSKAPRLSIRKAKRGREKRAAEI